MEIEEIFKDIVVLSEFKRMSGVIEKKENKIYFVNDNGGRFEIEDVEVSKSILEELGERNVRACHIMRRQEDKDGNRSMVSFFGKVIENGRG